MEKKNPNVYQRALDIVNSRINPDISQGGGSSVPKPLTYDYMPDGYPTKTEGIFTLMDEQAVNFVNRSGTYVAESPMQIELSEGKTYTVVWDGVEYNCVCNALQSLPYIGNLAAYGHESTGEPFLYIPAEGYLWMSYDSAENHTISVVGPTVEYKTIDKNFLPEFTAEYDGDPSGWSYDKMIRMYDDFLAGKVVLYREDYASSTAGVVLYMFRRENADIQFVAFNGCADLVIYINGVLTHRDISESGIYNQINDFCNNHTYWPLRIATGEESVGDLLDAGLKWNPNTQRPAIHKTVKRTGIPAVEITDSDIVVNGDSELILTSSTSGSTKKFKITVDDSGTITATEVM